MRQAWVTRARFEEMIGEGLITDDSTVAAYALLLLRERGRGQLFPGSAYGVNVPFMHFEPQNGTFTSNAPVSRGGGEVRECDGIGGTRCGVAGDAVVLAWPPGVRHRAAGPRMREHGGGDAGRL